MVVDTPLGKIKAPRRNDQPIAGRVVVGVRPESVVLGDRPGADCNQIKARLADVVFFGSKTALHFVTESDGDRLQVELSRLPDGLAPGVELTLRWPVAETMVYPLP